MSDDPTPASPPVTPGDFDNDTQQALHDLVDLLRLTAPDGAHWLQAGALALGPGEGMAWTEMARGLLVHWVRLEGAAHERVAAYRVLAPTEWNFHPHGVLASALQALPAGAAANDAAARLAVAFDPCVRFRMASEGELREDGVHSGGVNSDA